MVDIIKKWPNLINISSISLFLYLSIAYMPTFLRHTYLSLHSLDVMQCESQIFCLSLLT